MDTGKKWDKAIEPPLMTVLSDHPSREAEEDHLQLESRLSAVFDILRHKNTRCPITVGIYGDWGTGKTSAMRWLEVQLKEWNKPGTHRKDHPRVHPVWFDPWRYHSREEVWRGIIAEVILSLFSVQNLDRENLPTRMREAAKMFGAFLGRGFLHALANIEAGAGSKETGEIKIRGEVFRDIFDEYDKAAHPEKAHLNQFETTLRDWVDRFLKKEKGKHTERLAVFIDDIDRCLPQVTLEVLEAIKLYLNIEPLVFVIGLDRAVVDAVVKRHYSESGVDERKSRDYLNKLFQIDIQIPPSETQMKDYLDRQIHALNVSTDGYWETTLNAEHRVPLEKVIRSISRHNPREIKRLLNSALLWGRAAADRPDKKDESNLRFAQGIQCFLLQRLIQDWLSGGSRLLIETRSLEWFERLSEFAVAHPDFTPTLEMVSQSEAKRGEMLNPAQVKVDDLLHFSPGENNQFYELIASRPLDESLQPINRDFVANPLLWELLRIRFNIEVAQFAPRVAPLVSPAPAIVQQPDISLDTLTPAVLDKIAAALGKPVYSITMPDLGQLDRLDLNETELKDSDLIILSQAKQIKKLFLSGTKLTDSGLEQVSNLSALRYLGLSRTQVTDKGLEHVSKLSALLWLDLDGTQVSDKGLEQLSKLSALKNLYLSRTQVTDEGLKQVSKLSALQYIHLLGTQVTDKGLEQLSKLSALQSLHLSATRVTNSAINRLKRNMPNLRVHR